MKVRTVLTGISTMLVICGCRTYSPTAFTMAFYNSRNAHGSNYTQGNGWEQKLLVITQTVWLHELYPNPFTKSRIDDVFLLFSSHVNPEFDRHEQHKEINHLITI